MTDYDRILKPGEEQVIRRPPKSGKWQRRSTITLADGDAAVIRTGAVEPPPPPPDPARVVKPGENLAQIVEAGSDPRLELAAGTHAAFAYGKHAVAIRWQPGAEVVGGILVPVGSTALLFDAVVRDANRAVSVFGAATIQGLTATETGTGLLWDGPQARGTAYGLVVSADRMIRNTGTHDYGAMAVNFMRTVANPDGSPRILVRGLYADDCRVRGTTAPSLNYHTRYLGPPIPKGISIQYKRNEGSVLEAFAAQGWVAEDIIATDSQILLETGTDGTANCGLFAVRRALVYPKKRDTTYAVKGFKLRSAVNALVEQVTVDSPDEWAFNVEGGGTYGGSVDGLALRNVVDVSPSALVRVGAFNGTWTIDYAGVAGTGVWGDRTPAHGVRQTGDPFVDRANGDYRIKPGHPFATAASDGGPLGWRQA